MSMSALFRISSNFLPRLKNCPLFRSLVLPDCGTTTHSPPRATTGSERTTVFECVELHNPFRSGEGANGLHVQADDWKGSRDPDQVCRGMKTVNVDPDPSEEVAVIQPE